MGTQAADGHAGQGGTQRAAALQVHEERLRRELEALAYEAECWWTAPEADTSPDTLREGEWLHGEIVWRLCALEAIRRRLADMPGGAGISGAGTPALPRVIDRCFYTSAS